MRSAYFSLVAIPLLQAVPPSSTDWLGPALDDWQSVAPVEPAKNANRGGGPTSFFLLSGTVRWPARTDLSMGKQLR